VFLTAAWWRSCHIRAVPIYVKYQAQKETSNYFMEGLNTKRMPSGEGPCAFLFVRSFYSSMAA
ncbi:hypothetical protein, partial [Salmonella enterica]|uniref:hypothetical protein n=1 Tax=Salmonella enterica TaxID=28901 RepID=UPI001BAF856C